MEHVKTKSDVRSNCLDTGQEIFCSYTDMWQHLKIIHGFIRMQEHVCIEANVFVRYCWMDMCLSLAMYNNRFPDYFTHVQLDKKYHPGENPSKSTFLTHI